MKTNVNKEQLELLLLSNTISKSAEILGVSRSTVDRAIKIYGIKHSLRDKLNSIQFPDRAFEIIYGTLLGDGNLQYNPQNNNMREAYMRLEHGNKQKDYLFWKYEELKFVCFSEPKLSNTKYPSWYFNTRTHAVFTAMYQEFYPNGEKVLPKNFEQTISPLSLMVWFLDDGTNQKNQVSSELTVQGFLPIEIGRILSTLRIKFGLECNTVVRYDRRYQKRETNIRFSKEGTLRLFEIIRPLVEVECMRYKVYPCNDYVPNPH